MLQACRYVDEVIPSVPLITTRDFLDRHNLHLVAHGDDMSAASCAKYYGAALSKGQYRTVPYTPGISTTQLIQRCYERVVVAQREQAAAIDDHAPALLS